MFKLRGRKREARETESRSREENRVAEATDDKGDVEQTVELVSNIVEQSGASSAASVRSILKAAINSAEQIVDSVKTRAVAEAQQEAAKIIAEAKKEAEKVRGGKAPVQKETTEDIMAAVEKVAGEQVEEPAPAVEEVAVVKEEELAQLQEKVVVPVAEKKGPERVGRKERAHKRKSEKILPQEESQSLYTGQVELTIEVPVEPTMVAKLYNYLQTTPEIKFIRTVGSWNKGSAITVVLDKPIPLISVLADKLPEADILPDRPDVSGYVRDRRAVRRISISRKGK